MLVRHGIRGKLYEKCVEWSGFNWPLRGQHPKCSAQTMLCEYVCDDSASIFFIQLLSADVHNFGLSADKPDQGTLMIKACHLNYIVQLITVESGTSGNNHGVSVLQL